MTNTGHDVLGLTKSQNFGAEDATGSKEMEEAQGTSSQVEDNLSDKVMDSLGIDAKSGEGSGEPEAEVKDELPVHVKERLGRQEKRHKKELRALQQQMADMQARMANNQSTDAGSDYNNDGQVKSDQRYGDDQIERAVRRAIQHKEEMERQAEHQEKVAHVHKQYQALNEHLDQASDKYDDFDDVVRSQDAPYSEAMRDAALLIPNASDVFYKLGKNRDELQRISKLHPLDQAREIVNLSIALREGEGKSSSANSRQPISPLKNNPVSPGKVTGKTPASEIRRRMKAGDWK